MPAALKSDFLRKFENRLSVVGRDGTVNKVGEQPGPANAAAAPTPAPEGGGISMAGNLHPALADALFGTGVTPQLYRGGASHDSRDALGGSPSPRRTVKTRPTPAQLHSFAQEESLRFGLAHSGSAPLSPSRMSAAGGTTAGAPSPIRVQQPPQQPLSALEMALQSGARVHQTKVGGDPFAPGGVAAQLLPGGVPGGDLGSGPDSSRRRTRSADPHPPVSRMAYNGPQLLTGTGAEASPWPATQGCGGYGGGYGVGYGGSYGGGAGDAQPAYWGPGAPACGAPQHHTSSFAPDHPMTAPGAGSVHAMAFGGHPIPPPGLYPPPMQAGGALMHPYPAYWPPPPHGADGTQGMPPLAYMPPFAPPPQPPAGVQAALLHPPIPQYSQPPPHARTQLPQGWSDAASAAAAVLPGPPAQLKQAQPAQPPGRASRRVAPNDAQGRRPPAAPAAPAAPGGGAGSSDTGAASSGRRAQQSAPSSRFVVPEDDYSEGMPARRANGNGGPMPTGAVAGGAGGYSRRAAAMAQLQVPQTSDGLPHHQAEGAAAAAAAAAISANPSPKRAYKPYTGKVNNDLGPLGRLKPDLNTEELVQKRANADRVKMFSRNLLKINRDEIAHEIAEKPVAPSPPAAPSKVQKAREYAKHVPKPRPRREEPDAAGDDGTADGEYGGTDEEFDALAILERQHAEHQRKVAAIRTELGL
eukprot:jgi/Chrpa1/16593/Chrysochromulina_OHIO_Genome00002003-RA